MKYIGTILILVAFLSLLINSVLYFANRSLKYFGVLKRNTWRWVYAGLVAASVSGMAVFAMGSTPLQQSLFNVTAISSAWLLFLLIAILIVELLGLMVTMLPRVRGIISITLSLLLTGYSLWNAFRITVNEVAIPVPGLHREMRAALLSDIHLGNVRGKKQLEEIVTKVNRLKPEVVFNTGDMFDSRAHFTAGNDVLAPFKKLTAPQFFVYGNHDQEVGVQEVIQRMKAIGARVLLNEVAYFNDLQIIGLNNMLADKNSYGPHANADSGTIESTLNELVIQSNHPTIVLHHRPDGVNYMEQKGVDLLLAGHTHGGQIFPFTWIAKLTFGYNKGYYRYKNMGIFVSQGLGTILTPARLGTCSEITLIRLTPAKG